MKYLKTYEQNNTISIGDYVLCNINSNYWDHEHVNDFLHTNVGEVIDKFDPDSEVGKYFELKENLYLIKYENVPDDLVDSVIGWNFDENNPIDNAAGFFKEDILAHSKDMNEIKELADFNKNVKNYNI